MSRSRVYPRANTSAQWFGNDYPGIRMPMTAADVKLLWHGTQTRGWPGYDGGAKAPTLTYHPGLHAWRQHFYIDQSARALRDPSGTPVRENRDDVVQVEVCCYDDPKAGTPYADALDSRSLDDLAHFTAWMHTEWGLRLVNATPWLAFPASYGNSPARMTSAEFTAFGGICAHQHASGNDHGDISWVRSAPIVLSRAKALLAPPSAPPTGDLTMADAASIEKQINALADVLGARYDVDAGRYRVYAEWNANELERDQADAQRDAGEMGLLSQLGAQLTAVRADLERLTAAVEQLTRPSA